MPNEPEIGKYDDSLSARTHSRIADLGHQPSGEAPKKRMTMRQIGDLAGTSRATVSRVLMNSPKVDSETRDRVMAVIKEHNFRPNFFARGLRGARTGQISVIGDWMGRGFVADVIQGVDAAAREYGAHLLCSFAHGPEDYISLWRRFASSGETDGSILIAPPLKLLLQQVEPDDAPVVLCACEASKSRKGWRTVDSVSLDNKGAVQELMDHLIGQGCRSIIYLTAYGDNYDIRDRCESYKEFMLQHPELTGEIIEYRAIYSATREGIRQYLSDHSAPDAFVCFNDDMALGCIDALIEKGLTVPRDVAVTGFDNVTYTEFLGLTTMQVPGIKMGEEAGHLLFRRLNEKDAPPSARTTVIRPYPVFRKSSQIVKDAKSAEPL